MRCAIDFLRYSRTFLTACCVTGLCVSTPVIASSGNVTFEQILANPDDLELNLRYAREQIATGRLEQSAATLERMLLLEPEWDSARLLYAIVLYRLDGLKGSKRELLILQERDLTARQQSEVAQYLGLVVGKDKTTRFTGSIALGARMDSNPGRAAADNSGLAAGIPVTLTSDEHIDAAFSANSHLRLEHDLQNGRGDYLFAQLNGWINEYGKVNTADFMSGQFKAGVVIFRDDLKITPYARIRTVALGHEGFFTEYGGGSALGYTISPMIELLANGSVVYQNFRTTSFSPVGNGRDGELYTIGGGTRIRFTDTDTLTARGFYFRKEARNASFSYDAYELSLRYLTLLGRGIYLVADGSYRHTGYDAADPRYSPTIVRDDDLFRARIAIGSPLATVFSAFGTELPRNLADINLQIAGGYSWQDSNIPNLDISNWSGEILLIKRFAF